eukprot:TRINITY_DN2357_c0_g2_i1.p1 TRINITY_DN2357_c0_g2~~TRINITY_DN2357_c0_g2_i1.p1  ORF type:complete len:296 (-),score=31.61 TRINITY_DN2357_c0_g2_i1:109-909(-)
MGTIKFVCYQMTGKGTFILSLATCLLLMAGASAQTARSDYDFYVLSLTWTGSVCRHTESCPHRKDTSHRFNIHGFWPSQTSFPRRSPQCRSTPLDLEKFPAELRDELDVHWNGLFNATDRFLSHEWSKHGSCWKPYKPQHRTPINQAPRDIRHGPMVRPIPRVNDETLSRQYFEKALEITKSLNVSKMLESQNITPSGKPYEASLLRQAIAKGMKVRHVILICNSAESKSFLKEVRICLGLNYHPIDCPEGFMAQDRCGEKRSIIY